MSLKCCMICRDTCSYWRWNYLWLISKNLEMQLAVINHPRCSSWKCIVKSKKAKPENPSVFILYVYKIWMLTFSIGIWGGWVFSTVYVQGSSIIAFWNWFLYLSLVWTLLSQTYVARDVSLFVWFFFGGGGGWELG